MKTKITNLLSGKFPEVRKDGLEQIAMSLSLLAKTEEEATELIDRMTAAEVAEGIKEWRKNADAENAKAVETYRRKHEQNQQQEPPQQSQIQNGELNAEAIAKIVSDAVASATKPLQDRINSLEGASVTSSRQALLESAIETMPDSFRNVILDGFKSRQFESDEAFDTFLNTTKDNVAAFAKDMQDRGMKTFAATSRPSTGFSQSDDIAPEVKAYLASQDESATDLGGKKL